MASFNAEQQAAIDARNPFLLCAAGAGSGKTTVMVESVAQKLKENLSKDISSFLIITFTNEAAANMKRKVQDRLAAEAGRGQAWAARGLANLENATISTIHAFCKGLISTYFYAIEGMSPKFEIIEEARLEQMFREAFETALEDLFDPEQTSWAPEEVALVGDVMDAFRQADLVPMCRELYQALMGIPDPFDRLDAWVAAVSNPLEENEWAKEILFAVDMNLLSLEDFLLREREMLGPVTPAQCAEAAEKDAEILSALLALQQQNPAPQAKLQAILSAREAMPTPRLTKKDGEAAKEWNEGFKKLRAEVKGSGGVLDKAAKSLQALLSADQAADNLRLQRTLRGLAILLRATALRFREIKLAAQGIDYADMEQMSYELMKREDVREAVTESISDIYVDECQDVSAIQYAILSALTGGEGRTMVRVGDIKQSIYGFRSAAPDLMDRDIQAYSAEATASHRKIFFQQNYRSCAQVIECVNEVFSASMDRRVSEIDYTEEDRLKANVEGDFGPVRVILVDQDDPNADDMLEAQCEAAGQQIMELVTAQGCSYREIVILVRNASTDAPRMVEHFRRMHIPVLYDGGQTFYGLTEISSFLALLTVIDNDHTDVELVGALRSVPFSFSDADLAAVRREKPDRSWFWEAFQFCCDRAETGLDRRCLAARERIRAWREQARVLRASEFIWQLLRESGIYAVRGAYPDGRLRQLNLDSLYQRAVEMEKRGIFRLADFLREIGKLREAKSGDTGDTPAALGESDNFVRLMTMHKSKGLEFPVVILMNLQKDLRRVPPRSKMKISVGAGESSNPPLGVYVPVRSRREHIKRDTWGLDAFRFREVRTGIAEDTRLLYVAMTRAMQRLILIGHCREKDAALWREKTKVSRIWKTRSMLDLILPAVLQHLDLPPVGETASGGQWLLERRAPRRIRSDETPLTESQLDAEIRAVLDPDPPLPDCLWTGEEIDPAPLKTSVSSLLRAAREKESQGPWQPPEEEETVEIKRRPESDAFPALAAEPVVPFDGAVNPPYKDEAADPFTSSAAPVDGEAQLSFFDTPTETPKPRPVIEITSVMPGSASRETVKSSLSFKDQPQPTSFDAAQQEPAPPVSGDDPVPGFLLGEVAPRPAFMEEAKATAAELGSITHRFLRLLDFTVFRGKPATDYPALVRAEIDRMQARQVLTKAEATAIYRKGIVAFLSCPLGQRILSAERVEREWPFTLQLRPESPTMVQGIVDAAFLDRGAWILVDYKTDRDTRPEVFVPRHEKQMNWYRFAVEKLTPWPVREMWLFALRSGHAYPVRKENPDF